MGVIYERTNQIPKRTMNANARDLDERHGRGDDGVFVGDGGLEVGQCGHGFDEYVFDFRQNCSRGGIGVVDVMNCKLHRGRNATLILGL